MTDPSSPTQDRPLVTFALFAYNQEKYIREAVEGAFSQTYEPLEIILSDDCSSDRTFEIMQEMAAGYTGPHTVVINRNEENLGLISHVNLISDLSKGDYIVAAAGDDISAENRTKVVSDVILKNRSTLIHSNILQIDKSGKNCGKRKRPPTLWTETDPHAVASSVSLYVGATGVWNKILFSKYGKINSRSAYEDLVLGYRASLEGNITFIDEPLVKYRVGVGMSQVPSHHESKLERRARIIKGNKAIIASLEQRLLDSETSDHTKKQVLINLILKKIKIHRAITRFHISPLDFFIRDVWKPFVLRHLAKTAFGMIIFNKTVRK